MGRRVTLKEIAQKTGFSINSVSHALKGKPDISEKTRELIVRTAREMGYVANLPAQSLRTGRTRTVAVLVSDISNPLFGIMVREIEKLLGRRGYSLFVMNTDENEEAEEKAVYSALGKHVDGLILCPTQKNPGILRLLSGEGTPYVLIGRRFPEETAPADYIVWDDVQGGYEATSFLLSHGHQRILFIDGPACISSARERLDGYTRAFAQRGLPVDEELVAHIPLVGHDLQAVLDRAAATPGGFTAVFAFSDMLAWEAASLLEKRGVRIPEQVELIGFDDIQSQLPLPCGLSTVHTPKTRMAALAADTLLRKMEGGPVSRLQTVSPTRLILRDTTRR